MTQLLFDDPENHGKYKVYFRMPDDRLFIIGTVVGTEGIKEYVFLPLESFKHFDESILTELRDFIHERNAYLDSCNLSVNRKPTGEKTQT